MLVAFLAVVVAGPLFGSIADAAGFPSIIKGLVGYLRWPIGVAALLAAFAIVYALGPGGRPSAVTGRCARCCRVRRSGPALWFIVSLAFTFYVAHFGSYEKIYGTLGALISLLIWLWLGNLAFLWARCSTPRGIAAVDEGR